MSATPQPCAGAIVHDPSGRLLLIERGQPPAQGCWSVPGGRCRPGETPEQACVREVAEETGLTVRVLRRIGRVERDAPDGGVYVIDDFVCAVAEPGTEGLARAGDDAADVRWADATDLARLPLSPGLLECLTAWGCLPR